MDSRKIHPTSTSGLFTIINLKTYHYHKIPSFNFMRHTFVSKQKKLHHALTSAKFRDCHRRLGKIVPKKNNKKPLK